MTEQAIRIGKISSVNYQDGKAKIIYEDRNNSVTKELPFLRNEYDMPSVGDLVYVAHLSSNPESGIILGRYFYADKLPKEHGETIWRKELGDGAFIKYDRDSKTLTVNVENLVITGDITVKGNTTINGNTTIKDNTTINGNTTIKGNTTINGNTTIDGDTTIKGNTAVNKEKMNWRECEC